MKELDKSLWGNLPLNIKIAYINHEGVRKAGRIIGKIEHRVHMQKLNEKTQKVYDWWISLQKVKKIMVSDKVISKIGSVPTSQVVQTPDVVSSAPTLELKSVAPQIIMSGASREDVDQLNARVKKLERIVRNQKKILAYYLKVFENTGVEFVTIGGKKKR